MTENESTTELTRPPEAGITGKWFEDNVALMPLTVLRRYQFEYGAQLEKSDLAESERVEIRRALKAIETHLDLVLPKVPASFEDHDRLMGDRAKRNWPDTMPNSTLNVHLHLCELVDSWRMNPLRPVHSARVFINEVAEGEGRTKFEFDRTDDRDAFVKHYDIENFVVQRGTFVDGGCFLVLTNKFMPDETNEFLTVYRGCINRLSAIADARTRAIAIDGGKVGFITVDHFLSQEAIEMARIREARKRLGAGRNLQANMTDFDEV